MPAPKKPKPVNKAEIEAIELVPDAWPKFEKLVKAAAKGGPKRAKRPQPTSKG